LTVTSASDGAHGSVTINGDGTLTYTPDVDFNGTDSFTYTVDDGSGGTGTATVKVTVSPVSDAPVAEGDSIATNKNTAVTYNVLGNDSDVDGDSLTVTSVTDGANGTVTINEDGTLTYTPESSFSGTDSFTYTISDGQGGMDSATVTVTVEGATTAPLAEADSIATSEDTAVTYNALVNDSDVDGDSLTVTSVTDGANGTVSINEDGTVTYTPDADFNGTDSFTYTIEDGQGDTHSATVTVTVAPVNDTPIAEADSLSTSEDTAVTYNVLGNDSDADGDSLTVSSATDGAHGTVTINGDGTVTYTPEADFNGSDSFTYTISDGNGGTGTATITVTVAAVNDAPLAEADSLSTSEDTAVTYNVLGNDSDIDGDSLIIKSASDGAHGTVEVNSDGTVTYIPEANFNGTDSFTYSIEDGQGGRNNATVTVTVAPVNDAPVAEADAVATSEDTAVTYNVLGNDSDVDGDSLTVSSVTDGAHGTVTINDDGTVTYTPEADFSGSDSFTYTISDGQGGTDTATVTVTVDAVNQAPVAEADSLSTGEDTAVTYKVLGNDTDVDGDDLTVTSASDGANGTVTINGDGTVTYTPNSDFNGSDSFTYTVSDGNGGTDTATVKVTVSPVNDAPVAEADSLSTNEDTAVTYNVLGNDSDIDGDSLTIKSVTEGANGTVKINDDGTVTYTPEADFNGTDSFTYTVDDGNDGTTTATVTVTVDAVNQAPVAEADAVATSEDTAVTYNVLGNDTDIDGDSLTVSSVTDGTSGTVTINADGTLTYTPSAGFVGTDSFTYTVSDGQGGTATATVSVTVNDAPVAVEEAVATNADSSVTISVLSNDTDPNGQKLTLQSVTDGAYGTVTVKNNGTVDYTPTAGFTGTDTFTYTVVDKLGGTATATVTVYVGEADEGANRPDAYSGTSVDDVFFGYKGNDKISGGDGDDVLYGGDGNDALSGGAGNDILVGGAGMNLLVGGDGTDTAYYGSSTAAVNADLAAGTATGDAQSDVLESIENLVGSSYDDTLTGDADDNLLDGGAGSDSLYGGLGNDSLVWDADDSTIDGGDGLDTLVASGGIDIDLTAFSGSISGIERVDLAEDTGANTLSVRAEDILQISDSNTLTVLGDSSDTVATDSGWTDAGTDVSGNQVYTQIVDAETVTLIVDPNITVLDGGVVV
jgi:VCBS repeat-containing protein